jgi:hypothetical protein
MPGKERAGELSPYMLKKMWEESAREGSPGLFRVWQAKRRQAQTDLFWLCNLLDYAVSEKAHRDIIDNFFLKSKTAFSSPHAIHINHLSQMRMIPSG